MELNGLALEYQRYYGGASGDLDITDLVNNPAANGECRVFGLGLPEEGTYGSIVKIRSFAHDGADSLVLGKNTR